MKNTSVIILNWNGREYLEKFLPALIACTSSEVEIVVADNGSEDDSVDYLKINFPQVRIILLDKNYGFAEGYNRTLLKIDRKYSVLLNSDVEVTERWLEPLIDLLDSDKNISAVMPKIRAYYDRDKFEYAGACGGYIDRFGYPFCRGRILDTIEADNGQYDDRTEIFWATGACMVVRTEHFKSAGGFDASFFAHQEEIDLCWRWKLMGHKIFVEPGSVVYHVGGGTLSADSPRKLYLNYRNNLAMMYKNLPQNKLFAAIFTRMLLDGLSALIYILQGKLRNFTAVLQAHRDFYRMKPELRIKRERIHSDNISYSSQIYDRLIIWDYYSGHKTFSSLTGKFK
ncbi:MAG: glycosyltransferase family 2 protein [Rikenellaceae bacterium]|nr:glycosyltransferase family 2 protein [Rikenellaceae bacterium]